jgi:sugar diacid utilization regulator
MSEVLARPVDGVVDVRALHLVPEDAPALDPEHRPDVIAAFCRIADAFDPQDDVDTAVRLLARTAAQLTASTRCCVYLRDPGSTLFRGHVAVGASPADDERVRHLVCGTASDRFTREIVELRRPVLISDARNDARPVRSAMVDWGVRSVLGVPMLSGDDVIGIIFLDDAGARRDFSASEQAAAATFGRLAGIALSHALRAQQLWRAMQAAERQNESLKRARALDERLTQALVDARGVSEIARTVASMTGRECVVYDGALQRLGTGGRPDAQPWAMRAFDRLVVDLPEVRDVLDGATQGRLAVIDAIPAEGLMHRVLVSPVLSGTRAIGCVALCETGGRFTSADAAAARRMAMAVGIDFAARHRASVEFAHAREVLVRDLIAGTSDPEKAAARAEYVGLSLHRRTLVALVKRRSACGPPLTADAVGAACVAQGIEHWEGAATAEAGGVVVVLPLQDTGSRSTAITEAQGRLNDVAMRMSADGEVLAALSTVCADARGFRRAFAETCQVMRCLEQLGSGGSRASSLAADDLGAARLFLSAADPSEARRFCADVLAPLDDVSDPKSVDLLLTAQTFYTCGRSVRRTAALLRVHGNTVRYRLARIKQTTGRDIVGDPTDELDFFVALMILSLERRVPHDIVVRLD